MNTNNLTGRKLDTLENRANEFFAPMRDGKETEKTFVIEWRKSTSYGNCPAITDDRGDKIAYVSGCGFDKESTALANVLQFLGKNSEECRKVWITGGAGVRSVERELEAIGYKLTSVYSSKTRDCYKVEKIKTNISEGDFEFNHLKNWCEYTFPLNEREDCFNKIVGYLNGLTSEEYKRELKEDWPIIARRV